MKGPKYYTEWINIVDGYFKSLSPDVATYEFGTSFVVMGVLTVAYCITNKQEPVINKMTNHLPEVIAIFFGFSFTLMTIIGQIKENIKGDSKKQKLYREFEKLILQLAFEGVIEIALLLVTFAYKAIALVITPSIFITTVFMSIELFMINFIFLAMIRAISVLALSYLQK